MSGVAAAPSAKRVLSPKTDRCLKFILAEMFVELCVGAQQMNLRATVVNNLRGDKQRIAPKGKNMIISSR